ncbi:MAG TPA: DEAD/DEAH box helicase [Ktedonobacterales bacterium]|nr:DEAD/DEAH box helicase [Ktedonobacterales bacterium]
MTSVDKGLEVGREERESAAIPIDGDMAREFAALGVGPDALRAMSDLGYSVPTPIQRQTIPLLLAGRDVIAQAPTGTGKTAAYGLPLIERLDVQQVTTQALIVTPTRELAIQVAEALHALGKYRDIATLPIYGGQPYERQLRALARGVQIVVGTPGRLLDHINRKTLDLASLRTVVLDEADEMLDMGFIEDIEAILAEAPPERQTALFSATISTRITRLAERYLREPEHVVAATPEAVGPRVRQVYYETLMSGKLEALARILDIEEPESAIVFVRTRRDADTLTEQLTGLGYLAQAIHGEIPQAQRELVLQRFRAGHTQLLVATDIAARGLDIPDVSHVINYDLPLEPDAYVHRIGRTGRAGRSGEALTLVTPRDRRQLRLIEHATHRRLQPLSLPTAADVAARRRAAFREDVLKLLDAGQLDPFLALVEDLSGTHDPTELAAAAFKMAAQAREAKRPGREAVWTRAPEEPSTEQPPVEAPAARESATQARVRPETSRPRSHARDSRRTARLFLGVGRRDGVRPTDLVGAITHEAGVPGQIIGDIDIYDAFSFVEAPEDAAARIIAALNQTTILGRKPQAKIAHPGAEWAPRPKERATRRARKRP